MNFTELTQSFWNILFPLFVSWLPELLMACLILLASWILAYLIKAVMLKWTSKSSNSKLVVFRLLANIAKTAIWIIGAITALGSLGVNINALVASLGLSGFALSFALKDTLSNILSGMMIILYRPFNIEDHIQISGLSGKVIKIDLRYTTLQSENQTSLIPNSMILNQPVVITN